jgi:exopolysaccharide/PEP-CTERM locus tyrosine autokinase
MGKFYTALEKSAQTDITPNLQPSATPDLQPSATPEDILTENLVMVREPASPVAEYFRFLRSNIIHRAKGNPPRTIMVTSALSGDGKTFVSSNLAACIAMGITEHVLLIDCDLRNPSLQGVFALKKNRQGLSAYLNGEKDLKDVLYKTRIDKLTLLPGGDTVDNPSEVLSSEKMGTLITEVRDRYPDRFIVIDSAPLELAPEVSVLTNQVDGVLVVIRYGKTPRNSVKAAIKKIPDSKLLGTVFNGYDKPLDRYYHGCGGYGKKA